MSDFRGKDRRGFPIAFPQKRWDHLVQRKRFLAKGSYPIVMAGFEGAELVIDNPPLAGSTTGPERVGDERYIANLPGLVPDEPYLVIPVIALLAPRTVYGTTFEAGTRVAWTAYTDDQIPAGRILWKIGTP